MSFEITDESDQRLNRIPPAYDKCELCYREEEDGITLKRCSTCKTKFYCSMRCQNKDWKKHKFECSLLPLGTLVYREPLDASGQAVLDGEVQRVSDVLQTWIDAYDAHDDAKLTTPLPEDDLLQHLDLAPPYDAVSYTRLPPDHLTYPFRLPFTLIARLFLTHATTPSSSSPPPDIQRLEDLFAGYQSPDACWAPKYMCLPGMLSPGEYAMIAPLLVVFKMEMWRGQERKKSGEGWGTLAVDKRFVLLAAFGKRRYMTKGR
ncbi:hypothetical protein EUX98_g5666 [Antrodiella citrinella]|uniref:MYND-type domain-containing protein n=1 Tax=Antrodiella citrinella TaxID=2447956 RepID=A0A4S4MQV8_9APHY|nr:hypothetical protein EUX98_g5666 [Antrodiella citrinella]